MSKQACPKCNCKKTKVIETRLRQGNIYRRLECPACGHRWSTIEMPMEEFNLYTMEITTDDKVALYKLSEHLPSNLFSQDIRKGLAVLWRLTH